MCLPTLAMAISLNIEKAGHRDTAQHRNQKPEHSVEADRRRGRNTRGPKLLQKVIGNISRLLQHSSYPGDYYAVTCPPVATFTI